MIANPFNALYTLELIDSWFNSVIARSSSLKGQVSKPKILNSFLGLFTGLNLVRNYPSNIFDILSRGICRICKRKHLKFLATSFPIFHKSDKPQVYSFRAFRKNFEGILKITWCPDLSNQLSLRYLHKLSCRNFKMSQEEFLTKNMNLVLQRVFAKDHITIVFISHFYLNVSKIM